MLIDGIRVDVYRNLNKRPAVVFSLRQKGKVLDHRGTVTLSECRMKHASPKQLQEVRTGARQVCQWISGLLCDPQELEGLFRVRLLCDPKKSDGFCRLDTGERIDSARYVLFSPEGCFAVP